MSEQHRPSEFVQLILKRVVAWRWCTVEWSRSNTGSWCSCSYSLFGVSEVAEFIRVHVAVYLLRVVVIVSPRSAQIYEIDNFIEQQSLDYILQQSVKQSSSVVVTARSFILFRPIYTVIQKRCHLNYGCNFVSS